MQPPDPLDNERTLLAHWVRYLEEVVPRDASDNEIELARKIFYSGAMTVVAIILKESKTPDEFEKMLCNLLIEFQQFEDALKAKLN